MGGGAPLLWLACLLGAGGVGVLRYAWSLPERAIGWNAAGWGLIAASVGLAWQQAGAWGTAIAALVATAAAFAALTVAGIGSPRRRTAASNRRTNMLPQPGESLRIGRRVATFLLVVPAGLAASFALAIAVRGLATLGGAGEADANVAALFTVPLAWAALATALLMQATRRGQITTLLASGALGLPFLLTGLGT